MMLIRGKRLAEIAELMHLSKKTVATYKYRVMDKLNIEGEVELARLAQQFGLIEAPMPY